MADAPTNNHNNDGAIELSADEPGEQHVFVGHPGGYNEARFYAYLETFSAFLEDDVRHPQELVSMLHDTHWPEVPRALAVALYRAARKCTLRFTLVEEFGKIYEYVVFSAFASCEPDVVATWFLQNTDVLIRDTITQLLRIAIDAGDPVARRPHIDSSMRMAFRLIIGIAGAISKYTTVTRLRGATGPHVVLVVSDDEQNGSYIRNGLEQFGADAAHKDASWQQPMTYAHVLFMDTLAEVMLEDDAKRDVTTWNEAFGHYAGHDLWRGFGGRCLETSATKRACSWINILENEVRTAFATAAVERRRAALLASRERAEIRQQARRSPTAAAASPAAVWTARKKKAARKGAILGLHPVAVRRRSSGGSSSESSSSTSSSCSSASESESESENDDAATGASGAGFRANQPISAEAIEMLLDEAEELKNVMRLTEAAVAPPPSTPLCGIDFCSSPPRSPRSRPSPPSPPPAPPAPPRRLAHRARREGAAAKELFPGAGSGSEADGIETETDRDERLWAAAAACPDPSTALALLSTLYPTGAGEGSA